MKDFSKENVRAVIEAAMKKYNVEDLYAIGPAGLLLDVQYGFEFFTDCQDKEFCKELSDNLSDIDNDILSCVTRLSPKSKEMAANMLHLVYSKSEYVGDRSVCCDERFF